ncbi:PadR family transcriptional regulator [Halobacillus sp. BAB-2008]|uniref:PadR family transcriptional regulator n=1 Tax=Halobacillus sp. BAB-2008 TaxID=1246484 RepID=UPI0002A4F336|nr:PadR family transcriptional regulator [Halobacillus sp. BAB-2008]ELK47778.1 PadR-like family transcriptional regulator [Halobacillus sp. BAB-2008]
MGRRVLKYAILGLLSKEDKSGYDITAEFKGAIGQFWSAKHSQIYVELKKLLEENLISLYIEMAGAKLEKKMYHLTSEGEEELKKWLTTLPAEVETEKDTFALRMYFLKDIPENKRAEVFENQKKLRKDKLCELKSEFQSLFGPDTDPLQLNAEELGHYFVLTKAITREEGYVAWLEESIHFLQR